MLLLIATSAATLYADGKADVKKRDFVFVKVIV